MEAKPRLATVTTHQQGKAAFCKRELCEAAITFLGGSESQTHLTGLVSGLSHPTVCGQRHLPVGSLGLGR
jgi:hypothetical protein